jgi:hypothetical protein
MHAFGTDAAGPAAEGTCLQEDENIPTVERVAEVVVGIPVIGEACNALRRAGWRTTLAGNRITVNDEVFAQFIGVTVSRFGPVDARWVIYHFAGTPPVRIVGAEPQPC